MVVQLRLLVYFSTYNNKILLISRWFLNEIYLYSGNILASKYIYNNNKSHNTKFCKQYIYKMVEIFWYNLIYPVMISQNLSSDRISLWTILKHDSHEKKTFSDLHHRLIPSRNVIGNKEIITKYLMGIERHPFVQGHCHWIIRYTVCKEDPIII